MRLLQALSTLVFFLLLAASAWKASVLEDACKSFAATHKDVGYDYCVKFFQADNGSATADKRGLAAIGVKITAAAAKKIAGHIAALRAAEKKDKRKLACLSSCAELYSDALGEIGVAARGIASGGLGNAVTALSAVVDAPGTCEEGFEELDVPSPLAAEDDEFGKGAAITLCVTAAA
ncbi:hypothetical protein ACP4OV_026516 [Aristida adscensionis]